MDKDNFKYVLKIIALYEIIVIIAVGAIILCMSINIENNNDKIELEIDEYFNYEVIERASKEIVFYDKNTGVMYYKKDDGITPIYNTDGTIKIYKGE